MAHTKNNEESRLLNQFGTFSKNMVDHHHLENLSEFVLHDLCSDSGFDIKKAAYLVHNPDFECVKGVAGFHQPESFAQSSWQDHKGFTAHMKQAAFNQQVRAYNQENFPAKEVLDQNIEEVADYLNMSDPSYHVWNSKHNNQGVFIFEGLAGEELSQGHLRNFLHMLSFCPIF